MISEWDKNNAGNVALTPIVSMDVQLIFGGVVGFRLELSQNPDRTHTDLRVVQVGMSPEQARDMIQRLQWCIDHLETLPPASGLN
jgi:hypothetical protein